MGIKLEPQNCCFSFRSMPQNRGCGGQIRFGIPFWLVGEFTTHFFLDFRGIGFPDVHWGCDLAFDPWPEIPGRKNLSQRPTLLSQAPAPGAQGGAHHVPPLRGGLCCAGGGLLHPALRARRLFFFFFSFFAGLGGVFFFFGGGMGAWFS